MRHSRPRPLRRTFAFLLPAICALLVAADGRCGAPESRGMLPPSFGQRAVPPVRGARGAGRRGDGPDAALTADSAAVRQAADLVRRARAAERGGAPGGAAPGATLGTVPGTVSGAAPAGGPLGAPPLDPARADSARRAYLAAAALVPEVADWLRLRAAALVLDAGARADALRALTVPAARERAPLVDALARARGGDAGGAADALAAIGRPAQALAVRLQGATDPAARAAVRSALLELARGAPNGVDAGPSGSGPDGANPAPLAEPPRERARTAAVLLDSVFGGAAADAPLAPAERLDVARALADVRDAATLRRAAAGFAAAREAGAAQPADVFAEAGVLARLGRWRDAAGAYGRVPSSSPLGPAAAYARGHALLRAGDGAGARAALRAVADAAPGDSSGAAARFLLAELTADDGNEGAARREYERAAEGAPGTRWARLARFRAGVLAYAAGDARGAATNFDAAASNRAPGVDSARGASGFVDSVRDEGAATAVAAAYWAGRAWAAAGDSGQARARWGNVLQRDSTSYYAWRAATRLGAPWRPVAGSGNAVPTDADAEVAGRRAALLELLGLTPEAGYERDWLVRWAGEDPARLLAAAHALVLGPRPGAGIRIAARAVDRGAPRTSAVWRLLDPLPYGDALRRAAVAARVDPALAAGVIRQESNFTADAVSPVGARGLMQLMPDVGRGLWRGEGAGAWSPDLLFVPAVNLTLGMRHLAAGLGGYPDPAYALAAYNAGASRVTRWRRQPGAGDPELFVERIPYAETRDYVRIVLRNRELYRALYGL